MFSNSAIFRNQHDILSEDDTDDSISLTSTVGSQEDPDNTYIVENILAERYFPEEDRMRYLVKWEGYPIERASWEPIEMFDDKNTINEWKEMMKQRQENGGSSSPPFDWEQWEEDRFKELEDKEARRLRRERKREKLAGAMGHATSSGGSRASSTNIGTFIVSDGEIVASPGEESNTEVKKTRRRRVRGSDDEDSYDSADSLMEDLAKREQRKRNRARSPRDTSAPEPKKQRLKGRSRRSIDNDEDGDTEVEEHFYQDVPPSKKPFSAQNSRPSKPGRRVSSNRGNDLDKNIAATTSKLSMMGVQQRNASAASINSFGSSRTVTNPANGGPRRNRLHLPPKPSASGLGGIPGMPRIGGFISLSQQNKLQKRGRNEPAPDINALELFHAGDPRPRKVSTGSGIKITSGESLQSKGTPGATEGETLQKNEEDLRLQKRRRVDDGVKVHALSLEGYTRRNQAAQRSEMGREGNQPSHGSIDDYEPGEVVDNDKTAVSAGPSAAGEVKGPLTSRNTRVPTGPAGWQATTNNMDVSPIIEPPVKPTFECILEIGSSSDVESIHVKFTGFSSSFTSFVDGLNDNRFWVSRFLEDAYITNFLVPELGVPCEYADMEMDRDKSQSFLNSIAVSHGAGVVLHEGFSLLIFQPSNDKLRSALKTPMQQTRTPLRAVAYPPFDVQIPMKPIRDPIAESLLQIQKALNQESMNGLYIHTLLERLLGLKCAEILQNSREGDHFVIYCPQIASAEAEEMETALKYLGRSSYRIDEIPNLYAGKQRERVCVLVHFSLRRQLHLLPHIRHLKSREQQFYFFGTRLETTSSLGGIETHPVRFWNFGTLIMLTPKFVLENPRAMSHVLNYQRVKAASTTLCFSGAMLARVEAKFIGKALSNEAEEVLKNAWLLTDKKSRGEAFELQIPDADGYDEFEIIADAFALYQLEHCSEYRRFMIGHSVDEDVSIVKAGVYNCIEFHNPESLVTELFLSKSVTKPANLPPAGKPPAHQ